MNFYSFVGGVFGEDVKGASIDWLCSILRVHTSFHGGGSQSEHQLDHGGHRIGVTHYSSGTLGGTRTYVTEHMVINPYTLVQETESLEAIGVDAFHMIDISGNCLSVTPFHRFLNRFREMLRPVKKGTVGVGVGEALRMAKISSDLAVFAKEFGNEALVRRKIEKIRRHCIQEALRIQKEAGVTDLPEVAKEELKLLHSTNLVDLTVRLFATVSKLYTIVDDRTYIPRLLNQPGIMIGESSHGALHHPRYGFHPHTTQIDPTGQDILDTLKEYGYQGESRRFIVFRSYTVRIGAGPLVTQDDVMKLAMPEACTMKDNEWLGPFRIGPLDLVALRYSVDFMGGPTSFAGAMVSFMDLLASKDHWPVCRAYTYEGEATDLDDFFVTHNDQIVSIKVHNDDGTDEHMKHQQRLTELLWQCRPVITELGASETDNLEQVFRKTVSHHLGVPVAVLGFGPSANDRFIVNGWEHLFTN